MNDVTISFGRKVLQAESMRVVLDLERMEGRSSEFNIVDALVGEVLIRSLRGERVVEMIPHKDREHTIMLHGLSAEYRSFVEETYRLDCQQARGAWFLPSEVSLRVGTINLPAFFRIASRFTSSIAEEEHCKVSLGNSASAFFVWALLEPFFDALFEPFTLRGRLTGNKSREDQLKSWSVIDARYKALGLELSDELAVMRYGGGWHKLRSQEQMAAKQRLLATLTQQIEPAMVARYRVYCFRSLLEHYYKKANADGRVRRKQALTRSFERTVAGYFGGDWLAFLAYIGEGPHPEEQIVTALPKTRLHVGGTSRAEEVASQMGLPAVEVARMMAAYWQQSDGLSPIEQRVDVLRRYWKIFDEIHARQEGGMSPLWGLVEDHRSFDFFITTQTCPIFPDSICNSCRKRCSPRLSDFGER